MKTRRLPGISFQAQSVAAPDELPRMDIAGFVGFAASGPIDVPVAIEDVVRFEDIFGDPLALAWNRETGTPSQSQLAPAVRAFFRNGGKRCWVVRVAGTSKVPARASTFPIPGLIWRDGANRWQPAACVARSEGSWADQLMLNVTLSERVLAVDATVTGGIFKVAGAAPGDLVRIELIGPVPAAPLVGFLPLKPPARREPAASDSKATQLDASNGSWFETARPGEIHAAAGAAAGEVAWQPPPADVARLGAGSLPFRRWGAARDRFVLELDRPDARGLRPGAWLQIDPAGAPPGRALLLLVDEITDAARPIPGASPVEADTTVWARARNGFWTIDAAAATTRAANPAARARASVVELELWVRDAQQLTRRLAGLGFQPSHARALAALPLDRELYPSQDEVLAVHRDFIQQEVAHPRFALAFPPDPAACEACLLPLGVPGILDAALEQSAVIPEAASGAAMPQAARDGIGTFGADLFLDPDLADASVETLLSKAFNAQYGSAVLPSSAVPDRERWLGAPRRPRGRRRALTKLHALLPIEEVSLLAVPDAIHAGWGEEEPDPLPTLDPPVLDEVTVVASRDSYALSWSNVARARGYELQESSDPLFSVARAIYSGPEPRTPSIAPDPRCPRAAFFRVRATSGATRSAWSNTRTLTWPDQLFDPVESALVTPPVLQLSNAAPPDHRATLRWSESVPTADRYVVEVSQDPSFAQPRPLRADHPTPVGAGQLEITIQRRDEQASYYRVRAVRGAETSPWSNTAFVLAPRPPSVRVVRSCDSRAPDAIDPVVRDLHLAILRLCAARSDLFAVLSVPICYRSEALLAHQRALSQALADDERERTLSFGGIYHPWPVVREDGLPAQASITPVPPDGPVVGIMAARALAQGAWLPPANRVVRGACALDPLLNTSQLELLFASQVNPLAITPRGIAVLSAQTLSPDSDVSEINVRRLLQLLRRLALREGLPDVFLPHDASLRRLVQRRFEEVLGRLFTRGAFAGATEDEAFAVVTDAPVNTPATVADGRLAVELRVAPALPMAFITVRLVQSASGLTIAEGL